MRLMTSSNLVGSCTLYRKVRWLLGFEDAIGLASRALIGITKGDQAAAGDEQASTLQPAHASWLDLAHRLMRPPVQPFLPVGGW